MLTHAYVNGIKVTISEFKKDLHLNPTCAMGHALIAKKGTKVIHHFAHAANQNCDPWREGMTNWHFQWQDIVADRNNLEVCLDENGVIVGYSSFNGSRNDTVAKMTTTSHIADIINPKLSVENRPMVIEIQHSPISEENVIAREEYYKNMIWVFDFTPRVVKLTDQSNAGFNRMTMVDGRLIGLMDKIGYLAVLNAPGPADDHRTYRYLGDCDKEIKPMWGTFVIIHTKTKYWFASRKPTYFDTGFGILRLIRDLNRGFAILMYMTYQSFFQERMPDINYTKISGIDWFRDLGNVGLINKMGFLPPPVDITALRVSDDRVEIVYPGRELENMGFLCKSTKEYPNGVWCHGNYYDGVSSKEKDVNLVKSEQEYLNEIHTRSLLAEALYGGTAKIDEQSRALSYEAIVSTRLCMFLGLERREVVIDIEMRAGNKYLVLHCNPNTYKLKDKFKQLGMEFRQGNKKKVVMEDGKKPSKDPTYRAEIGILAKNLQAVNF